MKQSIQEYLVLFWCLFVGYAYGMKTDALWEQWKSKFGKQYGPAAVMGRRQNWEKSVQMVAEHNMKHDLGLVTYKMGLNEFSDMSWNEFKSTYLMNNMTDQLAKMKVNMNHEDTIDSLSTMKIPKTVDWRKNGMGSCGSCWTFSVVGVVEGQYKKTKNKLVSFSKQELLDCGREYSLEGCGGGWPEDAMNYIVKEGLASEKAYPYEGYEGTCRRKSAKRLVRGRNLTVIDSSESKLTQAIAKVGPISICMQTNDDFMHYRSGIFISDGCGKIPDHAMLAVGYGRSEGQDYYLIKNSWGINWGEAGYVRVARNRDDMCGITSHSTYLTLA